MGLENALSEITLVLFTSLAPSGAIAVAIIASVLVFAQIGDESRTRLDTLLCVPLVIAMVGLIASATHLGNPANALYVFMGVGRSPMSNEVFSAVVFLGLTGMYWLYTFSLKPHRALQKVWLCAVAVSAVVFVAFVGKAYSVETIITWNTIYGPLGIAFTSLLGGPLLAVLTLRLALRSAMERRLGGALVLLSAFALACSTACFVAQGLDVMGMSNHIAFVEELVPCYWPMVIMFAIFGAVGVGVFFGEEMGRINFRISISVAALVCVFAGVFVMRFAFYMMHMTVGVAA